MVYTRVKWFMVERGVRLNDFSIVERKNRYFDTSATTSKTKAKVEDDSASPSENSKVRYTSAQLSLSRENMHLQYGLTAWLTVCSTVGLLAFAVLDQWITFSLGRRIVRKYLLRKE
jgi:hypothetical protein